MTDQPTARICAPEDSAAVAQVLGIPHRVTEPTTNAAPLDIAGLGNRIKAHRLQHGWSQSQLAGLANTNQSVINQAERGNRFVSLRLLADLAALFDVKPGALLDGDSR